jgi:Fic family protein
MKGTSTGTSERTCERTYLATHPWITFSLDTSQAPYLFWMDLGAIQSKIEHVANALLPPEVAEELHQLYLAKGVHATTAIEGNTLSEVQVHDRIVKKAPLPESKEYLGKEIDNIVSTCNFIGKKVLHGKDTQLTVARIKNFNRSVLRNLPTEDNAIPGGFRKHSVGVANYRGAPWQDCPYLTERLCQWLNDEIKAPYRELSIGFAVIKAILAHLYIAWIHPFADGNGRTARLVEFQILLSGRTPSIAAHLLSNFYNQTRTEYYRHLDLASKSREGPIQFIIYALRGLRDALDEQIQQIRIYQWEVAWRDYVYKKFRNQKGEAVDRRRLLALELPKAEKCKVLISQLRRLTPEIAELYANKTIKTLNRDVNELLKMDLIQRVGKEVVANGAILTQLLPGRRALDDTATQLQKVENTIDGDRSH